MVLVEKKIGDNAKAQERTHPFWCYCIIDQHQTDFFCFFQMKTDFAKQTPTGAKRRTGGLPRPDWWKDSTLFGGQVVPLIVLLKNIHFFSVFLIFNQSLSSLQPGCSLDRFVDKLSLFKFFRFSNIFHLCSLVVPLIDRFANNLSCSIFLDFQNKNRLGCQVVPLLLGFKTTFIHRFIFKLPPLSALSLS